MNFKGYLKDNIISISLMLFAVATIETILLIGPFNNIIKIYVPVAIFIAYFTGMALDYWRRKKYYKTLESLLESLDQKYLIAEIIPNANFIDGKILKETLKETDKSMLENVNEFKYMQEDYKEYIELWIHEIKIPITASKMIIENNKNEVTTSIDEELDKIENYIEQALFYARSNTVEKDYIIKQTNLKEIVNSVIKRNKKELIEIKANVSLHNLENEVQTDSKWVQFILNQIIQNSMKYKKQNEKLKIEIYSIKNKENIILYIVDNGIGIKKGEITRVFEKGFTGYNGRILGKKSTGIGLYLCKKLCDKLGIAIELNSQENIGTEVRLVFPQSSFNLKGN